MQSTKMTIVKLVIPVLRIMHLAVVLFVLLGWILPWRPVLLTHLVFIPLMIIQWKFNKDTCYLTNLENWLTGNKPAGTEEQGQFIKSLLARCCQPLPSDQAIKKGLYTLLAVLWVVSCYRVYF